MAAFHQAIEFTNRTLTGVVLIPSLGIFLALLLLYLLLMTARVHLERQRAALDELDLAEEDAS